jgi:50S ribosomal protein L16 3-hydroxylase
LRASVKNHLRAQRYNPNAFPRDENGAVRGSEKRAAVAMTKNFLGLTPARFMRLHWQKKPLLVRDALPRDELLLQPADVIALAAREDAVSRLVLRNGERWEVRHGPFTRSALKRLPASGWSLLVQNVNHFVPAAQRLLQRFAFLPYARLDDVMVSYAPAGGGVGPHFDSYDVFLLQGTGMRRWRVSTQKDLEIVRGAPLRILKRLHSEHAWTVESGDLLYLPPRCAHDGVALTPCVTYSIGFRAPTATELAGRFLDYLQDTRAPAGLYADPELRATRHPGRLDPAMVRKLARMLRESVRWNAADVARFAGSYLTEPKPHVVFEPPRVSLGRSRFARAVERSGAALDLKSLMLVDGKAVYINGESRRVGLRAAGVLARLADARALAPVAASGELLDALHEWYRAGYVRVAAARRART